MRDPSLEQGLRLIGMLVLLCGLAACAGGASRADGAREGATAAPSIVVGTFNIRYDNAADGDNAWRHRRAMVADILRSGEIWGLQEALPSQVAELLGALPEFDAVWRTRERDPARGEACPILFRRDRWSLDPAAKGVFWLSETPQVAGSRGWDAALPRIATYARLVSRDGRGLWIVNLHLDHRGEGARLGSSGVVADWIASRVADEPVVVLGDFNCGPGSDPIARLESDARIGLRDAWRAANPRVREQGTFNGWNAAFGDERIDFVFVSPGIDIVGARIDTSRPGGRWPSDHAPVTAEVALRSSVPSGSAGWRGPAR